MSRITVSQRRKKQLSLIAENHIARLLYRLSGIPAIKTNNSFYDLDWTDVKIEVKSAQLCINRTKYSKYRANYYGFTGSAKQMDALLKEKCYFAFVLMIRKEPIYVKFVSPNILQKHVMPYGSYDKLRIKMSVLYGGFNPRTFISLKTKVIS